MQARIKSPALTLPGAREAIMMAAKSAEDGGLPRSTLELVNVRVGQINGCSVCVDMHSRALEKLGEKSARIYAIATWREAPYYTDAERAALALAEGETRISDRAEAVPGEVWKDAARHFGERQLSGLGMS